MKTPNQNPTATSCADRQEEKIDINYLYILLYLNHLHGFETYKSEKGLIFKYGNYNEEKKVFNDFGFERDVKDVIYISSNLEEFNNYIRENNYKNITLNHG